MWSSQDFLPLEYQCFMYQSESCSSESYVNVTIQLRTPWVVLGCYSSSTVSFHHTGCGSSLERQDWWSVYLHGCQMCGLQEILTVSHNLQEFVILFFKALFFFLCVRKLLLVQFEMGVGGDSRISHIFVLILRLFKQSWQDWKENSGHFLKFVKLKKVVRVWPNKY